MAVDRTNTIQILYSTADTAPASVSGLDLGKGELAWVDHHATPGNGGANGRLYIGDGTTADAVPRWIGGIGTGVAAAAAGVLTGTTLKSTVVTSSLTEVGSIATGDWEATDVAVLHGGTGSSSASGARSNLGLVIGTDVQAYDAQLADIAGLSVTDSNFIVGDGSNFVLESASTARTSLGLGTAATTASSAYATSAQGTLATNALPKAGGTLTGDLVVQGDFTVSGGTSELSSTVIAITDKELLLAVTTGIMTASVARSNYALTLTMESAHGLADNSTTGYEVPITGSANQTALPDGVYKVVYSSDTVLTATSPATGDISGGSVFAASVGLGIVTDSTATGAGIVVPRTVVLGNASITYEGATDGWTLSGNQTMADGNFTTDIASHDETTYGLALAGTLVTSSATELNLLDGITTLSGSNTGDESIATATATGTVELFSNTTQTVAGTAVSTTTARTYGIQLNSGGQAVVNVPWTDTSGEDNVSGDSGNAAVYDNSGTPTLKSGITGAEMRSTIGAGTSSLAIGTSSGTALEGDTSLLAIGTSSGTALEGDTSLLAIGTTSSTAMAGDTLSAQDKTDISNLSGSNSGDQTLTGLNYLVDNAADTMSVSGAGLTISDINGTGSGSTGGFIRLQMNDGAVLADNNRLGVIEFAGAEDTNATFSVGARIEAIARSAWDGSNNDADLVFYTTDGTTQSAALTLDADNDATFTGGINMAAKSIVMTPSTGDTITFAAAANGALTITTVDTAAHGADVAWVIDGSMSWAADTGMDLGTTGVITNATLAGGTF